MMTSRLLSIVMTMAVCAAAHAQELVDRQVFAAQDTLSAQLDHSEHRALLGPMTWDAQEFIVRVESPGERDGDADWLVSFPSPLPQGKDSATNTVYLDWFAPGNPRNADGITPTAPVIVIIPETDRRRLAAKALARCLRQRGVHAFVLQPPGYGRRGGVGLSREVDQFLPRVRQAVADARRARDAVTVLPYVKDQSVHLAGISLGGFLALLTAELDTGYDGLFILLAGVDLHSVVTNGQRDAAAFRGRFEAAGYEDDTLRDLLWQIEPLRAAGRLNADRTWLYAAAYDTVVPPATTQKLADAINLPQDHHRRYPVDHYSGILLLPGIAVDIAIKMQSE